MNLQNKTLYIRCMVSFVVLAIYTAFVAGVTAHAVEKRCNSAWEEGIKTYLERTIPSNDKN